MLNVKSYAVALAAAVSLGAALAATTTDWKSFHPAGSTFTISMPGDPKAQSQSNNNDVAGKMDFTIYSLQTDGGAYLVQDVVLEKMPQGPNVDDAMLKGVQEGFMKTTGATEVSAKVTKLQGYAAREMVLQKGAVRFKGFTLNAGSHNFIVLAVVHESKVDSGEVTKFLESFRIEKG
ncbi:MAG: hypothetical protein QOJ65_945 [Fimbriimonadaceae bacterium]|jgi:hypothetical protein|nr:hypothetical protein [Fimbriimonadaceae bacterium]